MNNIIDDYETLKIETYLQDLQNIKVSKNKSKFFALTILNKKNVTSKEIKEEKKPIKL